MHLPQQLPLMVAASLTEIWRRRQNCLQIYKIFISGVLHFKSLSIDKNVERN